MASPGLKNFNFNKLCKAVSDVAALRIPHQALYTPDILFLVFSFCLPSDITCSTGLSPLNLSQVCRAWREVTFSRKTLWSRIVIKPLDGTNKDKEFQQLLQRCEYWIRKSCGAPLSIDCSFHWDCNGARQLYPPGKVHDILRQLFSASQSTESLCTFAVPSRVVELKLGPMFYEGADEGINLELSKALSLRRLEIARPVNLVSSHWNFQNLRILSLATRGSASLKTIVALLESATNLEQLKIAANIDTFSRDLSEDAESNHVGRSRLSSLHSLEVTTTGTWSGVLAYIFDRLEVPSLCALTVSFAVDHPSLWRSLTELMEDSRMPLKVFHLACQNPFYSGIPRDIDVLPVLEQCPSVEFLYLYGISLTTLLGEAMDCDTRPIGVVCPKLQTLCLGHHTIDRTDFVCLSKALASRWRSSRSVMKLGRVFLNFEDPRLDSALEYFKKRGDRDGTISLADEMTIEREKDKSVRERTHCR